MSGIALALTDAGVAALAAALAPAGNPVVIAEIGLTATDFVPNPAMVALPGEFKRLAVSGKSVSGTIVHMTAQDNGNAAWTMTGLGVYLADGTLFGVYDHTDPATGGILMAKAAPAAALFAFDITFDDGIAPLVTFGDASFLYPPATEAEAGVARIATQAIVDAGNDDTRFVTAKKLAARLAGFFTAVNAVLNAFGNRVIDGTGLVTGGGTIGGGDIGLNVAAATGAERVAATRNDVALTPASFENFATDSGGVLILRHAEGIVEMIGRIGGSFATEQVVAANFPEAFPNQLIDVSLTPCIGAPTNGADFWAELVENSMSVNGFSVQIQSLSGNSGPLSAVRWRAVGR